MAYLRSLLTCSIVAALLIAAAAPIAALTPLNINVATDCWDDPGTGQRNCNLFPTHFTAAPAETDFILSSSGATPDSWHSLQVSFPSTSSALTLTLRRIIVNSLLFNNADAATVVLDDMKVNQDVTSPLTLARMTLSSASALQLSQTWTVFVARGFTMLGGSSLVSTTDGDALYVAPTANGATVTVSGATISVARAASSTAIRALVIAPVSASTTVASVAISDSVISASAGGTGSTVVAVWIAATAASASAAPPSPLIVALGQITFSGINKFNATATSAITATGLVLSAASPIVDTAFGAASLMLVGVSTATGRAVGLSLGAVAGNTFSVRSVHVFAQSTGATATGIELRSLRAGAALDVSGCYVRAAGVVAAGNSVGLAFDATQTFTGYALRVMHSTFFTSVGGGAGAGGAFLLAPPAAVDTALIFLGNNVITAASGVAASAFPASMTGGSALRLRCNTLGGASLSAATFPTAPAAYTTFLACNTCSHAIDCNASTTTLARLDTAGGTGKCLCTCNSDVTITAWLPLALQCSGALGVTTATTTTTTSTTTTSTSTTSTTAPTTPSTTEAAAFVQEQLPYATVLGLTILGVGVGLILLVILVCFLCFRFCAAAPHDEDEPASDDDEDDIVKPGGGSQGARSGKGGSPGAGGRTRFAMPVKGYRPPPPPRDGAATKRDRYVDVQYQRLVDAHVDEIARLEAAGEHERAAELRRELAELRAEARQKGKNKKQPKNGRQHVLDAERDDVDPDIALTPQTSDDDYHDGGNGGSGHDRRQRELLDDPAFRARVALLTADRLGAQAEREAHDAAQAEHLAALDGRLDRLEQHAVADADKLARDLSPPSQHTLSPGASTAGGTPSQRQSAAHVRVIDAGTGRSGSGEMREPFNVSPFDELYNARPRLSRTSPFRFSVTPPNAAAAGAARDSVGMIALAGNAPAGAATAPGGGLRVVALRGGRAGSSSDEDQDRDGRRDVNDYGVSRRRYPLANPIASRVARPIVEQQQRQQQHNAPDEQQSGADYEDERPATTTSAAPRWASTSSSASPAPRDVNNARRPLPQPVRFMDPADEGFTAAPPPQLNSSSASSSALAATIPMARAPTPPMAPIEPPPRRGSPLRQTAQRFMMRERSALSPQLSQYSPQGAAVQSPPLGLGVAVARETTPMGLNNRYWRP